VIVTFHSIDKERDLKLFGFSSQPEFSDELKTHGSEPLMLAE